MCNDEWTVRERKVPKQVTRSVTRRLCSAADLRGVLMDACESVPITGGRRPLLPLDSVLFLCLATIAACIRSLSMFKSWLRRDSRSWAIAADFAAGKSYGDTGLDSGCCCCGGAGRSLLQDDDKADLTWWINIPVSAGCQAWSSLGLVGTQHLVTCTVGEDCPECFQEHCQQPREAVSGELSRGWFSSLSESWPVGELNNLSRCAGSSKESRME